MNTKKVIKRLAAVATGAAMLGATVMGAFAADLSDYPDMFVSDGTFDGYFVVGEAASSVDNLAMTDIATNMWYMGADSDSTTTTTLEGDAWLAATSSNFLELNEHVSAVESYLDESMLGALADGEISNAKGSAEYEQFMYFNGSAAVTAFQEDDEDSIGFFYKIASGAEIAHYVLEFTTSLESDIDSNSVYDDIEDEVVTIMGKSFTIVTATNESAGPKLVLMGGAASDTLSEGETTTYTVNEVDYEVEVLSVTSTQVQFSVNGETTSKLADSETDVLDDGVNIGVTDLTYQDYAGGIHAVTFFIGSDKLELKHGSSMKYNEETISDAAVSIASTESGGDIAIDRIEIRMTAEDDLYIGEGQKLSEAVNLDEPQVLVTGNWDIEMTEVTVGDLETTKLSFSESDEQADLSVELADGEVSIPLLFSNSTSTWAAGEKDGEWLVAAGMMAIEDENYFILSTNDPDTASNDARSYLLQYKGADGPGEDNPKVRIKNVATSETYERSMGSSGAFDLKLGGTTFNFVNATGTPATLNKDHYVNFSGSDSLAGFAMIQEVNATGAGGEEDSLAGWGVKLRTADNHEVEVRYNGTSSVNVNQSGLASGSSVGVVVRADDTDLFDNSSMSAQVVLNATISHDTTNNELDTASGTVTFGSLVSDPDDSDLQYARSRYGELYTVSASGNSGGPSKYTVDIPSSQAEVMFYVSSGSVTSATSSTTDGSLSSVRVVDATKLDSEVSSVSSQNLIVVGGPCVNTVAAELMGNPSDCTEGYSAGVASVKLFENGDSVAMLVAGYSGDDTRLAGQVLAHRYDELSGDAVEIEGTTYSDASIGEASEEMAVEEEEVVEEEAAEEEAAE